MLAGPPTPATWAPANPLVPAPRRRAHNSGCLRRSGSGHSPAALCRTGLGGRRPLFCRGWGVQIRECPRPPHCKVASCGEQGPGGGGYVSFRFFVFVFVFLTCRSAARLGAASGTERRWLCFPHAPRHCGLAASPAAAAPHPTPGPGLRPERLAPPCCAS